MQDRIKDSFARQGMMETLGAQIDSIAPGEVVISAPITPATSQQHGVAHAALAFAIGDSAAGYSALSMMEPDQEVVTAEIKINLLTPARGERLRATGRVVKFGGRLVVVAADIHTIDGDTETLTAIMQGTMVPIKNI